MQNKSIESGVEAICRKGCREVRRDIQMLEQGETPPELSHLSKPVQQIILDELKVIMSVYGDNCRV
jgi:hypothetical protein